MTCKMPPAGKQSVSLCESLAFVGHHLVKSGNIEVHQGAFLPCIGCMEGKEAWQVKPPQLAGIGGILGQQAYPCPSFRVVLPWQRCAQVLAHHFLQRHESIIAQLLKHKCSISPIVFIFIEKLIH